ncbi:MAG: sulfite exporter TauE/SafE family protein [Acidimicrobiaceae bacterium]|nr:sulfite exporter TauE/SafE family protein [Acidimicrobiaceae bacterium]
MFFASAHPNNLLLVLAGLVGGFLVGITGMGGGALMTPVLILLFKIDPKVAIASDLVSSLVNKPLGGLVHARRGTVDRGLVVRLVAGSVPAAFLGAFALNAFSDSKAVQADVKTILGWALIVACVSLLAKSVLGARRSRRAGSPVPVGEPHTLRTVPTVLVGVAGGFLVGMTSVGSGSLMMVLLMLLYPRLSSSRLVGTDLVQAVPLVASATVGQLVFGHVDFGLAGALIVGSLPGVYLGALISSRAPDGIVRPLLVFILTASALALLFANNNTGLEWAIAIVLITGIPLWGAVDAALRPSEVWQDAGLDRTNWVAALGIGAPFGVGLLVAVPYFARVRRRLKAVSSVEARQASAVQAL